MNCGRCFKREKAAENVSSHPIVPPKSRKKVLFKAWKYKNIDKLASEVSLKFLKKDLQSLVQRLTKQTDGDELGKVRSLFVWMTRLKLDDVLQRGIPEGTTPKPDSPLDYLSKLKANLINHAHLYQMLCKLADIPCEVINGINKNAFYKIGHHVNQKQLKAQWNAVYVHGEWRLLDTFWASCVILGTRSSDWVAVNMQSSGMKLGIDDESCYPEFQIINNFYFLTDPDMFICTHLPDDPQWQLLPQPINLNRFENTVYIRDKFFSLELAVNRQTKNHCVLKTVDGLVEVGFGISLTISASAKFKFLLYNYKEAFQVDPEFTLEHYVLNQLSIDSLSFVLRFPKAGTYRFDIFGSENADDLFDLVCSYVIQCATPMSKFLPLPFIPESGWGPTIACHEMGITPKTHDGAIIKSSDGSCTIQFQVDEKTLLNYEVLATDKELWNLKKTVLTWMEDEEMTFKTRFTEEGEYALKIVAENMETLWQSENVCNYLIIVHSESGVLQSPFPLLRGNTLGPTDMAKHLDIKPVSHKSVVIKTTKRELSLVMTMAENVEILAEITNNDIDNRVIYTNASREQSPGKVIFNIQLPNEEEFGINLYARNQQEPQALLHVYTYYVVIEAESDSSSQKSAAIVGLDDGGAQNETSEGSEDPPADFSRPSIEKPTLPEVVTPVPVETAKDKITVRVITRLKPMICELAPVGSGLSTMQKISCKTEDSDTLFTAGLPELGKYTLNLFEEISPGFISMFGSFYIHRREDVIKEIDEVGQGMSEEDRRQLKLAKEREEQTEGLQRALKLGLHTKNTQVLQQTLRRMEELEIKDDEEGLMGKAKEFVIWLNVKDAITKAMSERNQEQLESLLSSISNNDLVSNFAVEVTAAKRLLEYLKRLERMKRLRQYRLDVMNIDAPIMAELRSYLNPPQPVHVVIMATCILLGEDRDKLQDWSSVRKIISQNGKMGLQYRVYQYDMEKLTIDMAKEARSILCTLAQEDLQAVSPAAVTFYEWAIGAIEETEYLHGQDTSRYPKTKPVSKIKKKAKAQLIAPRNDTPRSMDSVEVGSTVAELPTDGAPRPLPVYGSKRRQSMIPTMVNKQRPSLFSFSQATAPGKSHTSQISTTYSQSMKTQNSDVDRFEHVKAVWASFEVEGEN